ncbi:hypothetical protein QQP08_014491 [Theobroma cacao]|nr:hypothetical protein QQP08_014491 [Theobroma cacao]
MKASLFICFLLSFVLVFPFAFSARELHIVEHNGASDKFPVNPGTGKQYPKQISCHRQGKYYVCGVPPPPRRGT